jgi:hypothetical protein
MACDLVPFCVFPIEIHYNSWPIFFNPKYTDVAEWITNEVQQCCKILFKNYLKYMQFHLMSTTFYNYMYLLIYGVIFHLFFSNNSDDCLKNQY